MLWISSSQPPLCAWIPTYSNLYCSILSGSPETMSVWLGGNRLGEVEEAWVWSTGESVAESGDLWGADSRQGKSELDWGLVQRRPKIWSSLNKDCQGNLFKYHFQNLFHL